jgi:hypothetical protein
MVASQLAFTAFVLGLAVADVSEHPLRGNQTCQNPISE